MKPITNIREFIESVTIRGSEHYITLENVYKIIEYYESRIQNNTKDVIKD